jgi:hypothetical protein
MAVLAVIPIGLSAARLTLRDGTVVTGRMISGSTASVVFQDENGRRRVFDLDQVSMIDFNPVSPPALVYDQDRRPNQHGDEPQRNDDQSGQRNDQNRLDQNRSDQNSNRGEARPHGVWATLQPGTQISVRSDEDINAQTVAEGRAYRASIQQDIVGDNGDVVIPRGADASLIIRRVGEGQMVLDLDSVRVGGRNYAVTSTDIQEGDRQGIGRNTRTAEMVGGGAVLGTLLGAIAGGGKGAAIGAAAGAVAGGGVQVLTKGRQIRVPAETVLTFRLEQSLHLRER